jgi:hypothetical protein
LGLVAKNSGFLHFATPKQNNCNCSNYPSNHLASLSSSKPLIILEIVQKHHHDIAATTVRRKTPPRPHIRIRGNPPVFLQIPQRASALLKLNHFLQPRFRGTDQQYRNTQVSMFKPASYSGQETFNLIRQHRGSLQQSSEGNFPAG